MIERDFWGILEQGGTVMVPLFLASVVSVGVILERLVFLFRATQGGRRLRAMVAESIEQGELAEAAALCKRDTAPFAGVLRAVIANARGDRDELDRILHRRIAAATRELRRFTWLVGTIGSLAPFIGLLGTVFGIIRAFEHMAQAGSGGFAVVAAGISEALIATGAGLLVGVLSIFAYNAFSVRIGNLSAEMRDDAEDLLIRLRQRPGPDGAPHSVVSPR